MKLEIPHPDRGFKTLTRDGLTLITPRHDKFKWAPEDRVYRSVVIDENNEVVSSGFRKFGNFGELEFEDDRLLIDSNEDVIYTTKHDGSLGLRDIINGKVNWRTRGTLDGGNFREHIERAALCYPSLANPTFWPYDTLLFEFVSPNFRIILPYEEEDLIFLGGIDLRTLKLWNWTLIHEVARLENFRLVDTHKLPSDLNSLVNIVSQWHHQEGIVARTYEGDALIKCKSISYLALHRLRFMLSTRALRELCDEHDVTSIEDFKAFILTQGADWELLQDCEPIVQIYCNTRQEIETCFYGLILAVEAAKVRFPERKNFALEFVNQLESEWRPSAFLLLDNKEKQAKEKLHKNLMDKAFENLKELDLVEE